MAGIKWTIDEDEYLANNYGKISKDDMIAFLPKRSWDAIKIRAQRFGIAYYTGVHEHVQANLSKLLLDVPLAFYWAGFIAADGSFTNNRFSLGLANKDKQHVVKFCEFVECDTHGPYGSTSYGVRIQDAYTVPMIKEKFNFKPQKTYNPPDIEWMQDDLFLAFCIGFIDGDGCIRYQSGRKDCTLQIKNHSSWLHNLQVISDRLSQLAGVKSVQAKINNRGYASVCFGNCILLRFLKKAVIEMNLPVLWRKWDRINETQISRYELAKDNRNNVLRLCKAGMRNRDIAKELLLTQSCVSVIRRRLKEKQLL